MRSATFKKASHAWIFYLAALFLPFFIGLTVAFAGQISAMFWIVVIMGVLSLLIASSIKKDYSGNLFIAGISLFFALPIIGKITGFPAANMLQLLLVFSFFGISQFYLYAKQALYVKFSLFLFFAFLSLAVASTALGNFNFMASAYQLLSDFKPLFLLMIGFAITWDERTERIFWKFVHWFWLPAIILVMLEWYASSVYYGIFRESKQYLEISGFFPTRATGPFRFPQTLATCAAVFGLLIFSKMQIAGTNIKSDWFRIAMYVALIFFTVQRQELIAFVVSMLLIYIIAKPNRVFVRCVAAAFIFIVSAAIFWAIFSDALMYEIAQMGFGTLRSIENARMQIYQGSFALASQYFPLGSGLGTYGGAGAEKFNHAMYLKLGFGSYWWFGKESFLMDTYWPNSIAETGVIGACLLMLSYLLLCLQALVNSVKSVGNARVYWCFSGAGILYLILISVSSPSFQDPTLSFLPLIAFGIAYKCQANTNPKAKLS